MNDILKNHIHAAIMNLQIEPKNIINVIKQTQILVAEQAHLTEIVKMAYKLGYRDARRAAAKLIKGE